VSLDICWEVPACEHCGRGPTGSNEGHNFTHNMIPLWRHLGCYEALYHSHGRDAREIGKELAVANDKLQEASDRELARFNSPNGWGMVTHARPWLDKVARDLLEAPVGAKVRVRA